jgi:iron-sulfur cluster assembly protein
MTFPVTITTKALDNFRLSREKRGSGAFRLGVIGGGCSGFQYKIEVDDGPARTSDHVMTDGILEFRIDKKSAVILEGSTLDYIDTGLIGRGFSFKNPQEKSRCGCGVSFHV